MNSQQKMKPGGSENRLFYPQIDKAEGLGDMKNMKPRQIFSILLGIVVLSIVALFGLLVLQSQVFAGAEHEIAKEKWSNRTFSKYRLTVNALNLYMMSCIYTVEVQDEKVLSTYPTDTCGAEEPRTISGLFNWIMEYEPSPSTDDGCRGYVRLTSKYDMSLGYPYSIKPEISSDRRWLYSEFWMDVIGQKRCEPKSRSLFEEFFEMGYQGFEVQLLQPLP